MYDAEVSGATGHLHASVRHLVTAEDAVRIDAIQQDFWLRYPAGEVVIARLFELLRMPRRVRMPSLLVYAPPNSGKTRIITRFLELYARECAAVDGEGEAVLSIQAPPTVDEKRLYLEILRAMQAPTPDATVPRLRTMVVRQLEARGVRLLIIDEMQHILDQRPSQLQVVLNTIKYLSNELALSIAGFGSGEAKALVKSDEHLAQRFEIVGLPSWSKKHRWLVELVGQRVARLPLRQPTAVDKAFMNTLSAAAGGVSGRMFTLLEDAAIAAIRNKDERLTADLLVKVLGQKEALEHAG